MPLPGFTITPASDDVPAPAVAAAPVAAAAAATPVLHGAPATIVLPSGQRLAVTAHAITIGRLPECTIVLNDPNTSRRHAEIRRGLQGTTVVDLGSTNGTKVNGQRITGEHTLAAGDIITVGNTHLRFEAS
jgi:pSer/pThr/pTyr-binding forkhead associated (FHA) protein